MTTIEEMVERVRKALPSDRTGGNCVQTADAYALLAEVERLRGEVATLKARLDYPPAAPPFPPLPPTKRRKRTMTPVEAVARILCKANWDRNGGAYYGSGTLEQFVEDRWDEFTDDARAAIQALASNVSPEMAAAGRAGRTDYYGTMKNDHILSKDFAAAEIAGLSSAIQQARSET